MTRLLAGLAVLCPGFVCLGFVCPGFVQADARPRPLQAYLCDSAAHAIQFADVIAKGESEEMARDRVGRAAGGEVCGLYRGLATIESQSVSLTGGVAYKLTSYRFQEDQRLAWLAETGFAPADAAWSL